MDGVAVQQQTERHPGRRNGPGQDDPDHQSCHLPDREEAAEWTLSDHRALIDTHQLVAWIRKVGAFRLDDLLQGHAWCPQEHPKEADQAQGLPGAADDVWLHHQGQACAV